MNRKLVNIILAAVLLVVAFGAALPAAADEPVNVDPLYETTYQASAEDDIHFYYWWWTTTPGLVNVFLKGNETTYTLRDANDQIVWSLAAEASEKYWSDIFKVDFSSFLDYPMPYVYASAWEYPLGQLDPGIYTLTTEIVLKHTITDGAHVIRDPVTGERILPTPSIYPAGTYVAQVTIIVD